VDINRNRIRELRKDKGFAGVELAQKLGISVQYLYDIERGKRTLSAENAGKLSDIFAVTTDYLLGKTEVNLYDWISDEDEETPEIKESPASYIAEKELLRNNELLEKIKAITDKHGMELQDKRTLELLDSAFDFIKRMRSE
jgi:transcriptional regulator with XRE-family HTH domain